MSLGSLALAVVIGLFSVLPAFAQVHVPGYMRRDGTYVQPHMRSAPDNSYNNNWSTAPNVNPYTGERGTRAPHLVDPQPSLGTPYGSGIHRSRPFFGNDD